MADAKIESKAPPKVEAKVTQLAPQKLELSEHKRNSWTIQPEFDTPFEAILDPAYWAHAAAKIRRGDLIQVFAADSSYWAELLVTDSGRLFAKVFVLRKHELSPANVFSISIPEGWAIKYRGEVKKWCVLRGKDELRDGLSKVDAERWLMDHMKAAA